MFTLINESRVDAFGILAREYHHGPSGARLVHLKSERELHAFQVCFRTLPQDDSGVAHILEHSVLEGSRRFPQPGIFHKRAADLLGACNAMTGKDTTYYPFHSSDRKDFLQMLEIYLDSVFFPLLDRETFLQEGHHPEWKDPQDPAQGLGVVGVVYNEMKGVYSQPVRRYFRALQRVCHGGTVFGRDSGGDPRAIRELSYESFLEFHRNFYRPDNALFCYCGPLEPEEFQERIRTLVLDVWPGERAPRPALDHRFTAEPGSRHTVGYPAAATVGPASCYTARVWNLSDSLDADELLVWSFMMRAVVFDGAAPVYLALVAAGLGSPFLSQLDLETRPVIGVMNAPAERLDEVHSLIDRELEGLAREGLPRERLESVFTMMERELASTEDRDGLDVFPIQLFERISEGGEPGTGPPVRPESGGSAAPPEGSAAGRARVLPPDPGRASWRIPPRSGWICCRDGALAARGAGGGEPLPLPPVCRIWVPAREQELAGMQQRLAAHKNNTEEDHRIPRIQRRDLDWQPRIPEPELRVTGRHTLRAWSVPGQRPGLPGPASGTAAAGPGSGPCPLPAVPCATTGFRGHGSHPRHGGPGPGGLGVPGWSWRASRRSRIRAGSRASLDLSSFCRAGDLAAWAHLLERSLLELRTDTLDRWAQLLEARLASTIEGVFGHRIIQGLMGYPGGSLGRACGPGSHGPGLRIRGASACAVEAGGGPEGDPGIPGGLVAPAGQCSQPGPADDGTGVGRAVLPALAGRSGRVRGGGSFSCGPDTAHGLSEGDRGQPLRYCHEGSACEPS
jgi:hypothetical protein